MFGLPLWVWTIIGAAGLILVLWRPIAFLLRLLVQAKRFPYAKYQEMCAAVRGELTDFLKQEYPSVEAAYDERGNLVLRPKDAPEQVLDMSDIYLAMCHLPGMGADPPARRTIYNHSMGKLLAPALRARPIARATDGERIKPQFLQPEVVNQIGCNIGFTDFQKLGLLVIYVLDDPAGGRYITRPDCEALELVGPALHQFALDNLRRDFPRHILADVLDKNEGISVLIENSFNAVRLLLVPERLAPGQEIVALIPHREHLALLASDVGRDPNQLRLAMEGLKSDMHLPLLDRPVRVTRDGFELL